MRGIVLAAAIILAGCGGGGDGAHLGAPKACVVTMQMREEVAPRDLSNAMDLDQSEFCRWLDGSSRSVMLFDTAGTFHGAPCDSSRGKNSPLRAVGDDIRWKWIDLQESNVQCTVGGIQLYPFDRTRVEKLINEQGGACFRYDSVEFPDERLVLGYGTYFYTKFAIPVEYAAIDSGILYFVWFKKEFGWPGDIREFISDAARRNGMKMTPVDCP